MNLLLQASLLLSIASSALGQNEDRWDFDNANFCSTQRDEHEGQDSFCNTKVSLHCTIENPGGELDGAECLNYFLLDEEQPWHESRSLPNTSCLDAVNAVPTGVTAVFTWKMCNEDIDYPIYLNEDSTLVKFEDKELSINDIGTPVEPKTCRIVEYRHVLDLCDVNEESLRRKYPLSVQMQGRLARGGEEESEDDDRCYCYTNRTSTYALVESGFNSGPTPSPITANLAIPRYAGKGTGTPSKGKGNPSQLSPSKGKETPSQLSPSKGTGTPSKGKGTPSELSPSKGTGTSSKGGKGGKGGPSGPSKGRTQSSVAATEPAQSPVATTDAPTLEVTDAITKKADAGLIANAITSPTGSSSASDAKKYGVTFVAFILAALALA